MCQDHRCSGINEQGVVELYSRLDMQGRRPMTSSTDSVTDGEVIDHSTQATAVRTGLGTQRRRLPLLKRRGCPASPSQRSRALHAPRAR